MIEETYVFSGGELPDVLLRDSVEFQNWGAEQVAHVPNVQELETAIAQAIADKPFRLASVEIRWLRLWLRLTQGELGEALAVSDQTISIWERGLAEIERRSDVLLRLLAIERAEELKDHQRKVSVRRLMQLTKDTGVCRYYGSRASGKWFVERMQTVSSDLHGSYSVRGEPARWTEMSAFPGEARILLDGFQLHDATPSAQISRAKTFDSFCAERANRRTRITSKQSTKRTRGHFTRLVETT